MKSCEQTAALETNRGKQGPESRGTSSEAMNERVEIGLSEFPSSQVGAPSHALPRSRAFPSGPVIHNLPENAGDLKSRSLSWEDPLEKEMATHSNMLAWKIPWTEVTVHGVTKS